MRKFLCSVILLPLIALAGGKADLMKVRTVWNDGEYQGKTAPIFAPPSVQPGSPRSGADFVGRIDTVGGTTYDRLVLGASDQYIYVDPTYGVHVTWMYSAEMSGHADRNMRYNFYDFAGGAWNFVDPTNFMNSGVNAFTDRSGFGMLDVNPVTGAAYIVAHQGDIYPNLARDAAPGAGTFEPCTGVPNADQYLWPSMSLTVSERAHVAVCDDTSRRGLYYASVDPWCTWSTPIGLASPAPDPQYPSYICRASKLSHKVVISWVYSNPDAASPDEGYYRMSNDDGVTWDPPAQILTPPTFTPGSETLATFHIAGICPFLDYADNLHIVANIGPLIAGQSYIIPCEIWHWYQPTNTWSKIVRASTDSLAAAVGYGALYASRPTLCEGDPGELVCIWEEFDSLNVEPMTSFLRAEIRGARSIDNGATWPDAVTLTEPGTDSKRFPAVAPRMYQDSVWIRYMADQCAGFGIAPYAQGPITNNPIIVQRVSKSCLSLPAVAEHGTSLPRAVSCAIWPNPSRTNTTIQYELLKPGSVRLSVRDAAGRTVRVLADGTAGPGRYYICWDGRGERGTVLQSGVYFCKLETGGKRLTQKVVLLP